MAEYSDTTEQVFREALAGLDGRVPEVLRKKLIALLERGEFHDSAAIEAAIRETVGANPSLAE